MTDHIDHVRGFAPHIAALMSPASEVMSELGIPQHVMHLTIVVDLSRTNLAHYNDGMLQLGFELMYATALHLDHDANVPVFGWKDQVEPIAVMEPNNAESFFVNLVPAPGGDDHGIEGLLEWIASTYPRGGAGDGSLEMLLVLTDGGGDDEPLSDHAHDLIRQVAESNVFVQFVGHSSLRASFAEAEEAHTGASHISFMMWPRSIVDSAVLLRMILEDYPSWLESMGRC